MHIDVYEIFEFLFDIEEKQADSENVQNQNWIQKSKIPVPLYLIAFWVPFCPCFKSWLPHGVHQGCSLVYLLGIEWWIGDAQAAVIIGTSNAVCTLSPWAKGRAGHFSWHHCEVDDDAMACCDSVHHKSGDQARNWARETFLHLCQSFSSSLHIVGPKCGSRDIGWVICVHAYWAMKFCC